MCMHHIAYHHQGEAQAIWSVGFGIDARRTGRAFTRANDIGTYHKEARRIENLTWPYEVIPPPRFAIVRMMPPRSMAISSPRMGHQDGIISRRAEGAIGFVSDGKWTKQAPALKAQVGIKGYISSTYKVDLFQ